MVVVWMQVAPELDVVFCLKGCRNPGTKRSDAKLTKARTHYSKYVAVDTKF